MSSSPEDLTDVTVTLEVSPRQYADFEHERIVFGQELITHKITVGTHVLPGNWVVTATQRHQSNVTRCYVILTRLVES